MTWKARIELVQHGNRILVPNRVLPNRMMLWNAEKPATERIGRPRIEQGVVALTLQNLVYNLLPPVTMLPEGRVTKEVHVLALMKKKQPRERQSRTNIGETSAPGAVAEQRSTRSRKEQSESRKDENAFSPNAVADTRKVNEEEAGVEACAIEEDEIEVKKNDEKLRELQQNAEPGSPTLGHISSHQSRI